MTAYALPPASPFATDDGSADPRLAELLAAYRGGRADLHAVQQGLVGARVMVALLAEAGEVGQTADGRPVERTAHMSSVTIRGRDGRLAQPMFTSLAALFAWNPRARPFPSTAVDVARGAYAQGAVALVLDLAGPVDVVLEGPAMLALAECRPWLPATHDPDVLAAVSAALTGLPGLARIEVGPSAEADLMLTLHVPAAGAAPVEVAQEAAARLAAVDLLRFRLERGIDLAVTPAAPAGP